MLCFGLVFRVWGSLFRFVAVCFSSWKSEPTGSPPVCCPPGAHPPRQRSWWLGCPPESPPGTEGENLCKGAVLRLQGVPHLVGRFGEGWRGCRGNSSQQQHQLPSRCHWLHRESQSYKVPPAPAQEAGPTAYQMHQLTLWNQLFTDVVFPALLHFNSHLSFCRKDKRPHKCNSS